MGKNNFELNRPFLRLLGIPGDAHPKCITAACFTKIRSRLVCGAATVSADTGPGKEPKVEGEPLDFLCTCVLTISKSMLCFLTSVRNVEISGSTLMLGIFQLLFVYALTI